MFQQIATNPIRDLDKIDCDTYENRTQILSDANYFGSRQRLEFLLCESCFWCASHIPNSEGKAFSACPRCNGFRLESLPIVVNEISKFIYDSK